MVCHGMSLVSFSYPALATALYKFLEANGWKSQFGPEDLVRDDHWTELALDEWDGWDAVAWLRRRKKKNMVQRRATSKNNTTVIEQPVEIFFTLPNSEQVIQNDGDSSTLCAEAHRLAACVAELRRTAMISDSQSYVSPKSLHLKHPRLQWE